MDARETPALLARVVLLERACSALASLVYEEFPDTYSLAEIADTWGTNITSEQVDALRALTEASSDTEPLDEVRQSRDSYRGGTA